MILLSGCNLGSREAERNTQERLQCLSTIQKKSDAYDRSGEFECKNVSPDRFMQFSAIASLYASGATGVISIIGVFVFLSSSDPYEGKGTTVAILCFILCIVFFIVA